MNNSYALINSEGIVANIVEWDGAGDLFDDFQTCKLDDGDFAGPGYMATKIGNEWVFTKPEDIGDE